MVSVKTLFSFRFKLAESQGGTDENINRKDSL